MAIGRREYLWTCPSCGYGGIVVAADDEILLARQFAKRFHDRDRGKAGRSFCAGMPVIDVPIEVAPEEWVAAA